MRYYDIDYSRLATLLLPTFLRKSRLIAFVVSALAPVSRLHTEFNQHRAQDHYKLDHNWQKCYLQKALNDEFDVDERRIRIIEGDKYNRNYIFTHGEEQPKYLETIYIHPSSDYADTGVDFTVDMSNVLADIYDVRALVDFYKLDGTRYNVINLRTRQRATLTELINTRN